MQQHIKNLNPKKVNMKMHFKPKTGKLIVQQMSHYIKIKIKSLTHIKIRKS